MTLSLHEQRVLSQIERELASDPSLRALVTFTDPSFTDPSAGTEAVRHTGGLPTGTPDPEPGGGYVITDDGRDRQRTRRSRVLAVVATLIFFAGPAMLVPAMLTGVSLLALPVLAAPLVTVVLLVAARRRREQG